jgi:5-methylcytosine-specific restriction protein A
VCANHPYIFIFSGQTGSQHGYKDQWENPNVFSYTGEGQVDDMTFVRGNLALRDHLRRGKRVFLFIQTQRAFVQFESELEFIETDFFEAPDRNRKQRTAIKFFFKRAGISLDYQALSLRAETTIPTEILKERDIPTVTERKGLVTSRVGQGAYRKSILYHWEFRCAVTGYPKLEVLISSHIVPWSKSTNEERLDVNNGILLSPTYDALFDRHMISFENNGRIILADIVAKSNYKDLGLSGKEQIKNFREDNFPYLERHRELLVTSG